MNEFEGKVVIVTGTTGIGRAIAKRFATDGANVLALWHRSGGKPRTDARCEGERAEFASRSNVM